MFKFKDEFRITEEWLEGSEVEKSLIGEDEVLREVLEGEHYNIWSKIYDRNKDIEKLSDFIDIKRIIDYDLDKYPDNLIGNIRFLTKKRKGNLCIELHFVFSHYTIEHAFTESEKELINKRAYI